MLPLEGMRIEGSTRLWCVEVLGFRINPACFKSPLEHQKVRNDLREGWMCLISRGEREVGECWSSSSGRCESARMPDSYIVSALRISQPLQRRRFEVYTDVSRGRLGEATCRALNSVLFRAIRCIRDI